jgi:hypothetical protein
VSLCNWTPAIRRVVEEAQLAKVNDCPIEK